MPHRIAERLRHFREQKGWSKGELARQLGYRTVATVSHWETGKRTPTPENLERASSLLGCSIDDLDPEKEAFTPERRPARRQLHPGIQKSQTPADTSAVPSVSLEEDGSLSNGGLPVPDVDLFGEILGVWRLLRGRQAREEFVERAREHLGLPRAAEARRKNARR